MRKTIVLFLLTILLLAIAVCSCSPAARLPREKPEQIIHATLTSYREEAHNRFLCSFRTNQNKVMDSVEWYVPGMKHYRPAIGAKHIIYLYPGNRVKIFVQR